MFLYRFSENWQLLSNHRDMVGLITWATLSQSFHFDFTINVTYQLILMILEVYTATVARYTPFKILSNTLKTHSKLNHKQN